MTRFGEPEPLAAQHVIDEFDCGNASLNTWLVRYARQAAGGGSARTYVVSGEADHVVGYYALAAAGLEHQRATTRAARGQPRHPIPAVLLARLAVDTSVQGVGLGGWLLRDAMHRTLASAEQLGIRVLLVDAIDAGARAFYERWGFEPSPTDPLNLQMLLKDVRKSLE